jgi:uncharacterized protein YuzE
MKISYDPDVDAFHEIELFSRHRLALPRPLSETERGEPGGSEGVVLDYDGEGNLVGIDIDHASLKLDLRELVTGDPEFKTLERELKIAWLK